MLINLESHINMKHTQKRDVKKRKRRHICIRRVWKERRKRVDHHEVMSVCGDVVSVLSKQSMVKYLS
jgi:hypothetical protein